MQDRDSFYYRAIRTKLGDVAKTQYDLKEPLPETLAKALFELYEQERVAEWDREPSEASPQARTPHWPEG
jgi:hypothetical protein